MRSKIASVVGSVAIVFSTSAFAAEPSASDRETARALLAEGDKQYAMKSYDAALKAYLAADSIMRVPSTALEVAKAQEALGRLVEARDTCMNVARSKPAPGEPAAFAAARTACGATAEALGPRIPGLRVDIKGLHGGVEPTVTIDNEKVPAAALVMPRRVNPGDHVVVVEAPGYKRLEQRVTVAERENAVANVAMMPEGPSQAAAPSVPSGVTPAATDGAANPPASASSAPAEGGVPTYAKVALGVGAVGLVTGVVAGVLSLGATSDAKELCNGNRCQAGAQDNIDKSIALANVSNVGFALGIVGAGVGLYGVLARPRSETPRTGWSTYVSPTGAGITGRF